MRVLFATGTPANYMAPPRLGEEQIVCGPDWPDVRRPDGRWLSLRTPVGEYNLATIAAKLPPVQKPDVVVCLVDASWRNLPRGLGAFKCPRVLLVADTHHLKQPLLGMLRYATSEPFNRTILLYDRHHAIVFRSAGVRNLHWFPGLTFPHSDEVVRNARQSASARAAHIAFVGQVGAFHPRRTRLLGALAAHQLPVETKAVPQAEALRHYGGSLIGFNASLNGDLNLRVFEILATGAALLTDRLDPAAGLAQLLADDREMLSYGSPEELAERAAHAMAHPAEARKIGEAGARWFDENLSEARRRDAFQALAFDGTILPQFAFSPEETSNVLFAGAVDRLLHASRFYEMVQEMHRAQEIVRLAFSASVPSDVAMLCATLPRVQCMADAPGVAADLVVMNAADAGQPAAAAARLCFWDARVQDRPALEARLGSEWALSAEANAAVFIRKPATVVVA
jgi:hypothetical protein